jgi:beta-N-acetylhexosaminidase
MHIVKPCHRLHVLLRIIVLLACCPACLAGTIGEAKRDIPDGNPVSLQGVAVTAVFPGSIYVEEANRSAGIRIDTAETYAEGDVVNVEAPIETDRNNERYIDARYQYPLPTGDKLTIKPLGVTSRAFVGGNAGLFQKGIPGDPNLNTVGLLVTIWGPVSTFDYGANPSWFKIGDAHSPEIKVIAPGSAKLDTDWANVSLTGICSVERVNGQMIRVLKVRRASDIACHQSWVANRLSTMTLDEKIGQLFQVRFDGDTITSAMRQTIADQHIGGVIYFQYNGNLDDPVRSAQFSNDLQTAAVGSDGTGIPLLISMDQEGGRVTRITGGAEGPGNMGIGSSRSTDIAHSIGSVFGSEIKAVGANMDLAPDLDVNDNPANPVIGVRSFGEQPGLVSSLGQAYVQGLHSSNVIATGKHFPGHGDTNVDSHSGLPVVTYDFTTLDTIHGRPFREAIANGLDCIMSAHIVVTCLDPVHPATLSPQVMEGYLRGNLGFDGVVMTDSMGMAGITAGYTVSQASVMAIQAGVDLLSLSPDLNIAISAVKAAVLSGDIPQSRLDQAVTRILRLKHKYGLFANPFVDPPAAAAIVGSADHKATELTAARAAVTLVQNTRSLLPLSLTSDQKVLLVTVQSSAETTTDAASRFASYITGKHANTQSIAIVENPSSSTITTVKNAAKLVDVVIVGTSRSDLYSGQTSLVNTLCAIPKPVICVGLREPYELASFAGVNAYLAAYNYRNCGFQAAADVIFGDYNPSGLLPVTIPGLYDFGRGLSY